MNKVMKFLVVVLLCTTVVASAADLRNPELIMYNDKGIYYTKSVDDPQLPDHKARFSTDGNMYRLSEFDIDLNPDKKYIPNHIIKGYVVKVYKTESDNHFDNLYIMTIKAPDSTNKILFIGNDLYVNSSQLDLPDNNNIRLYYVPQDNGAILVSSKKVLYMLTYDDSVGGYYWKKTDSSLLNEFKSVMKNFSDIY